jgi:hypothetical protein
VRESNPRPQHCCCSNIELTRPKKNVPREGHEILNVYPIKGCAIPRTKGSCKKSLSLRVLMTDGGRPRRVKYCWRTICEYRNVRSVHK